jgi:perosamine synthetase
MIPLFYPHIPVDALDKVKEVLSSKNLAQGAKVDEFEKLFSDTFNVQYQVSTNSGTSALELAYELLDLKEGDEVISTPLTCTATNIPLLRRKVKIVWADINPKTLNIDVTDINNKLTDKTKAVVQVHLGGISAGIKSLPVPIVSDAAQALGVFIGDYTCCSFQAIKHITTGDGGMLVCPNDDVYTKARKLRWFGVDRTKKVGEGFDFYQKRLMTIEPEYAGFKYHMNDIDAVLGIEGLNYYKKILNCRRTLFSLYKELLKNNHDVTVVDGEINTYWSMTVLVNDRDSFAKKLFDREIETNVVHIRNDAYGIFGGRANLPNLDSIEEKYISLPLHLHMNLDDVAYICDEINKGW